MERARNAERNPTMKSKQEIPRGEKMEKKKKNPNTGLFFCSSVPSLIIYN